MPVAAGGGSKRPRKKTPAINTPRKAAYRTKVPPYDRSPRSFVKSEHGPKKAAAVGAAYIKRAKTRPFKKAVKSVTTQGEAEGSVRNLRSATKAYKTQAKAEAYVEKKARQFSKSTKKIAAKTGRTRAQVARKRTGR